MQQTITISNPPTVTTSTARGALNIGKTFTRCAWCGRCITFDGLQQFVVRPICDDCRQGC